MSLIISVQCLVFIYFYYLLGYSEILGVRFIHGVEEDTNPLPPLLKLIVGGEHPGHQLVVETAFSVRDQDKIHLQDGKRRTYVLESYPSSLQQQDPLEFKIEDAAMSKIRKKKKRIIRKKKHPKWYSEDMPREKEDVEKKKRTTRTKRKQKDLKDKDTKKKTVRDSRRFIKTPIKEDEDSTESIENVKKLSPVDIIVHIKMNDVK